MTNGKKAHSHTLTVKSLSILKFTIKAIILSIREKISKMKIIYERTP